MKNIVTAILLTGLTIMSGCEMLQEVSKDSPANTSSTVVDSVREQKEQTDEITNASKVIENDLESIDDQADSILNDIALVPDNKNYNIDPTLESIEDSAEAIKETVDNSQKEQIRIDESLEASKQSCCCRCGSNRATGRPSKRIRTVRPRG